MRAYLAALDSEHAPTNPERKPKALSPADPAAAWTTRGRHKVMFGYSLNYLIDLANAIIVDVEATPTRISKEVDATETMIERTVARFALAPDTLAADVAYGTGAMLGWLVGRGIDPHIPVWDQSEVSANGKFSRADFAYDHERDLYTCPAGKELKTSGTVHDGTTIKYIAKRSDCAVCPLKRQCTTGLERRISRDVHQDARDYAQALMQTEAYRVSRSARKKIETLFGEAKHNLAAGAPQTARPQRRPGRVLAHRHRPEPQTPGSARHEAAATAHDSVTNAQKPNSTFSIDHQPPQPIGSGGQTPCSPSRAGPRSRVRSDFLNSLSQGHARVLRTVGDRLRDVRLGSWLCDNGKVKRRLKKLILPYRQLVGGSARYPCTRRYFRKIHSSDRSAG